MSSNIAVVHVEDWDPEAFELQMSFEKATEKRKPDTKSPMTYININWTKYPYKRLILVSSKELIFAINRRKDQNNKDIAQDSWHIRWRHRSSLDAYTPDEEKARLVHEKFERFDRAMKEKIEKINGGGTRKQKERSYMGLLRTPEALTADYLYTSGQIMFDSVHQVLKDFSLLRIHCTHEEWDALDPRDIPMDMEKINEESLRYEHLYTPLKNVQAGKYMEKLPAKDKYENLIPQRSFGVIYFEPFSVGFTGVMISVSPKIHRCVFFTPDRSSSINDISGDWDDAKQASDPAERINKSDVGLISVFGGGTKRDAAEPMEPNEPVVKKPASETPAAPAPAPAPAPAAPAAAEEAPVEAAPVKVSLALGKPPAGTSKPSSSSSGSAKPSSSSSSSSSSAKVASSSSSSSSSSKKPSSSSASSSSSAQPK